MYEIISITSLGWTDGLLPSVSYADSSPDKGSLVQTKIRFLQVAPRQGSLKIEQKGPTKCQKHMRTPA